MEPVLLTLLDMVQMEATQRLQRSLVQKEAVELALTGQVVVQTDKQVAAEEELVMSTHPQVQVQLTKDMQVVLITAALTGAKALEVAEVELAKLVILTVQVKEVTEQLLRLQDLLLLTEVAVVVAGTVLV